MINIQKNEGFGLLEVSMALVLIGIVLSGGIQFTGNSIHIYRSKVTQERLKTLKGALNAYLLIKGHLPCPTYMRSRESSSNCTGSKLNNNGMNAVFLAGAIPVDDLGIGKQFMLDGWNDKFIYTVAEDFTKDNAGSLWKRGLNKISKDILVNEKYMYALISNGADRINAYNFQGRKEIEDKNQKNCYQNTLGDGRNNKFDPKKLVLSGLNSECDDITLAISWNEFTTQFDLLGEASCLIDENTIKNILNKCNNISHKYQEPYGLEVEDGEIKNSILLNAKLSTANSVGHIILYADKDFSKGKFSFGQKINSNYKNYFVVDETSLVPDPVTGYKKYPQIKRIKKVACQLGCDIYGEVRVSEDVIVVSKK
jgi:prepilin-type N-terminal cleavage/methylation domain-containing protein